MRIGFQVQDGSFRQWHARLLEAAGRTPGVAAQLVVTPAPRTEFWSTRAAALDGLLLLERTMSRDRAWLTDAAGVATVPHVRASEVAEINADILIDLSASPVTPGEGPRILVPTFDGSGGEAALWNALLEGRAPVLALAEPATGVTSTLALPALEAPHRLLDSAEAVLSHLVAALLRTVSVLAAGRSPPAFATTPTPAPPVLPADNIGGALLDSNAIAVLARRVQKKAAEKRDALLKQAPVWQVAYRASATRTRASEELPYAFFKLLADDGQRYYADPFVVYHDGWHHVFVEELPYATGRGVISHFVIDRDGATGQTRVVLEEPHHLSYPHVFRHSGQFWMMPEASAAGRLDLYRAERFPDRWVHHARLLDEPVHDATFLEHGGRLWIFAGTTQPGASSWDSLSLYTAERLEGPWQPHPLNPVLVDARSARPAGALYMHKGNLWRPAQDCTGGYGSALTLNRVSALDPERFRQNLVATLNFGPVGQGCGPHTHNFAAGIEIIDVFQPRAGRRQAGT